MLKTPLLKNDIKIIN